MDLKADWVCLAGLNQVELVAIHMFKAFKGVEAAGRCGNLTALV